jgi:hypothetical protein
LALEITRARAAADSNGPAQLIATMATADRT